MPIYANSEKTYEALLTSAGELAAEVGFANVSTRAVAARAGANISSIHYHFGSKDGLFEAVVKRVLNRFASRSIKTLVAEYEPTLSTRDGQVRIVQEIVRTQIDSFFTTEHPRWESRVIYQLMQYDNPLRELLFKDVMHDSIKSYFKLMRYIRGDMTHEEMVTHYCLLMAPIIFHSDYMTPILRTLDKSMFDEDYLDRLEELVVGQVLHSLGLS